MRDLSNAELAGLLRQAAPVPVVVARAPVAGYDVGLVPDVRKSVVREQDSCWSENHFLLFFFSFSGWGGAFF